MADTAVRIDGDTRGIPAHPFDRAAYTRAGLPWDEYYVQHAHDLDPTDTLGAVRPVGDWLGDDLDPWRAPGSHQVKQLKDAPGKPVEDGDWWTAVLRWAYPHVRVVVTTVA